MRWKPLLLLLLCACASTRQDTPGPAVAQAPVAKLYAPAIYTPASIHPGKLNPVTHLPRHTVAAPMAPLAPPPKLVWRTRTVLVRDTLLLDSLRREVRTERLANQAIRKKLKTTQAERDHWRELNLRKFWTLIWMGVFALLYVLFKVLASRVRVE